MKPVFKVKLAAIAKDEGFYLPLWIYHHLHFGFDVLDIRVNDTTDNSWQVLEKLKTIYGERLRFSLADKEMAECRAKDMNFQVHIYTQIYQETLSEDFTHLMFLDIDEYWCAANFSETIKDFLSKKHDFNVCMFQWLMEVPNHERKIDDSVFQTVLQGQKSDHVKSLLNMKTPVRAARIHNFIIKKGKYILPDSQVIEFPEADSARGILSAEVFEAKRLVLDSYFIYHQVFRSQEEYIAGLLRGNKQNGDDSLLKTNRFGFISGYSIEFNVKWQIPVQVLASYRQGYEKINQALSSELVAARSLVLKRKEEVLGYLESDIFLQALHKHRMLGLSPALYLPKKLNYPIKAKVKAVSFDEANNCCSIICNIFSKDIELNYELLITQSFNKDLIESRFNLLEIKQEPDCIVKQFHIEIDMAHLSHVIYNKWPPFCLAAKINDDLVLLERAAFRDLGDIIAPKARKLRKLALRQKKPSKPNFWQRLFRKI